MFKLKIDTKNAAFCGPDGEDYRGEEIVRILEDLIRQLKWGNEYGILHDINGNSVGEFTLTKR